MKKQELIERICNFFSRLPHLLAFFPKTLGKLIRNTFARILQPREAR
jgi:hypothetical protein